MSTAAMELAESSGALALGPLLIGVVVVAMLIGAFLYGIRVRRSEPPPPRPEEQPHLPDGGAVREVQEMREPSDMPDGGGVTLPHDMPASGNNPTRHSDSKARPRWREGHSGSWGNG
ncbi:DUF6479 family protein [Streptomyces broussonetiae]|uniref:DUF6479 family protein n=1 Tax=Streptomyces broussonetiae TaxID=2686304 RepID=A0ABV5EC58_9ACTN